MLQSGAILRHRSKQPLSERVSELLKESGLGYNEIERRTKGRINHSYLSKLVSGASANPRLDKLMELADLFNIPVGRLIGEEETEPEGVQQSRFWEMYEVYQRIESKAHRQLVDEMLDGIIRTIEGLATKKKAEGRVEALRKSK